MLTKPLPNAFPEITVLYLHDEGGALVGWYFHPNAAAIALKQEECTREFPDCEQTTVTYRRVDANG